MIGEAGYDTAHFGKWHLDGAREADDLSKRPGLFLVPQQRRGGFGTWIGYENNRPYFDCHVHGHREDGTEVPLHGDMLGSHGYFDASLPWEESIRIPFIIGGRSATRRSWTGCGAA